MDYRVIFSNPALGDLAAIAKFIAESPNGSSIVALKIGDELIALSVSLGIFSYRGTPVRRRAKLRKLSHRYYLAFYQIAESAQVVEIVRIWDGRQNPSGLILRYST